jgi:hypothetical protein
MLLFVGICEVYEWRWSWAFALDHLHGDRRAINSDAPPRRIHFQTIQEASIGIFEFDQGITNPTSQSKYSGNIILIGTYVAC